MHAQQVMGLWILVIALVFCGAVVPVWADDMDGDGVVDHI